MAQGHFGSRQVVVFFFFRSLARRRTMLRRGWLPAPDGWVQIIRGPRPPSVKWPSATATRQSSNTVKKQGQPPGPARRSVQSVWGHRDRGDDDPGVSSLKSAKRAAQVPPLSVHVSQCEQFVARAQKRLVAHDEERILLVKQLEVVSSVFTASAQLAAPVHPPPDWGAQVASLQ